MYAQLESLLLEDYRLARRRSIRSVESARLPHLRAFFQARKTIDAAALRAYIRSRDAQSAAPASINRELAALRRMHTLAEIPWPRVAMLPEAAPRQGFLTPPQFETLRIELPEHLRDPIAFLFLSSWRLSEMRGLTWSEVHLAEPSAFKTDSSQIVLRADRSKNGRARILPLRGELRAILIRALARKSPHTDLVFHHRHRHRPLADFRRAWRSACARAGVPDLLIHDLRRSAIRNFIRAGVRESVAMALSGHRTRAVFDRYTITDTADLVAAVEATGRPI